MDLIQLYNSNKDFEAYVDAFANTRGISPAEALEHIIVKEYAKFLLSR